MLELNLEIARRRIIQKVREIKRINARQRRTEADKQPDSREVRTPETEDREMRETFAMTAGLAKELGIAFEIPPEWA